MTESDKKAGDFDWDDALSEWDKKPLAPELAKEKTEAPQPPPLPKPPPVPRASPPKPPAPKLPPPKAPPPKAPALYRPPTGGEIKPRGGGLGALFGTPKKKPADDVDALLESSRPPPLVSDAQTTDASVITTAAEVETQGKLPDERRKPAPAIDEADVPEGAMYDPFADAPNDAGAPTGSPTVQPPPLDDTRDTGEYAAIDADDLADTGQRERYVTSPAQIEIPSDAIPSSPRAPYPSEPSIVLEDAAPSLPRRRELPAVAPQSRPPAALGPGVAWDDERPAAIWLDDTVRDSFLSRAEWLELEAESLPDKIGSARCLLHASEIRAIAGDLDGADRLAREALVRAPHLAMAHRQVRGLIPRPLDAKDVAKTIDAELRHETTPDAKLHGVLLAHAAFAATGDRTAAGKRLDQAHELAAGDVRVMLQRALRALATNALSDAALKPENPIIANSLDAVIAMRGGAPVVEGGTTSAANPATALRDAREALERGDVARSITAIRSLAAVPELARPALWLAAALADTRAATRKESLAILDQITKEMATPQWAIEVAERGIAARGLALGEPAVVEAAMGRGEAFAPADRVALSLLAGVTSPKMGHDLDVLASNEPYAVIVAAASSLVLEPSEDEEVRRGRAIMHSERIVGTEASKMKARLGRLLAAGKAIKDDDLERTIDALEPFAQGTAKALRLDLALRAQRYEDITATLATWGTGKDGAYASGLVAETAGLRDRAVHAYRRALEADPSEEGVLRALAALDPEAPLIPALQRLARAGGEGPRAALHLLEAFLMEENDPSVLEEAHHMAPSIPVAAHLAERAARFAGNADEVLRWVRERRKTSGDGLERALDDVREALFTADADPTGASDRLEEAHRGHPDDISLRELYERVAQERVVDRAAWREKRAATIKGPSQALVMLEASYEYDTAGDKAAALRTARVAAAGGDLARIALERAELAAGEAARLADELLATARSATEARERLEAYERLAELDAAARGDPASALLWHRSILEESPKYLPSLRHVEHALINERRDDELEPVFAAIARALEGSAAGECDAHAELASRMRMKGGDWDGTRDAAELASFQPSPTIWALRLRNAHARSRADDETMLESTLALAARASRPAEHAALLVRAAEAAQRLGKLDEAKAHLEIAVGEDSGDVVAWALLGEARRAKGEHAAAAEAFESLARSSLVEDHQLAAWYEAGKLFADEVKDADRAIAAFEQCATLRISHADIFGRLSGLYASKGARGELAALLERRISTVIDPEERVGLEIERGRALMEVSDFEGARTAFDGALAVQPDNVGALEASADLSAKAKDWDAAEQAWVRLARLLPGDDDQKRIYEKLGDLYATHMNNLSRAETAWREVLKRAENDVTARERLVDVYKRQNDPARAIEIQQELIGTAADPEAKRKRMVELAIIYEATHDLRKAEQTLESLRREAPGDVGVLRGLAEFYIRHKQTPAVNILLDRAAGDTRRAFAAGRFTPSLFQTMLAVYELRGKKDAAGVVAATLAAYTGEEAKLAGAEGRALDHRLDELLAPEIVSQAARGLLAKTGHALEAASPFDTRNTKPLPTADSVARMTLGLSQALGMPNLQLLVSPNVGRVCLPILTNPPAVVLGDGLLASRNEGAKAFAILRAMKLLLVRGAVFARVSHAELGVLVAGYLRIFNPQWAPPAMNPAMVAEATRRIQPSLPRQIEPDVGLMALEVVGSAGQQPGALGAGVLAWANHAALLAVGDPNAALDAIAWIANPKDEAAPSAAQDRANFITRTPEAKDIIAFSVSDAYAEARVRVGLAK